MLGASVVAQGWSQYAELFLKQIGIGWPSSLGSGDSFDLLAFLLIAVLTTLIAIGIKESMRVNLVLVAVKLFIVLFVIVAGIGFVNTANYSPFVPPSDPSAATASGLRAPLIQLLFGLQPAAFGISGIVAGASIVFFAYIGFDVVATTAEEARNPQRDLPRGIIASLIICTVLYIAVALVITGMVPFAQIDPKAALASAFTSVGKGGYATLDLGRRGRRADDGRDDADDRRDPGRVRHGAGLAAAAEPGAHQPAHRHPDADHAHHRRAGRPHRLADPDRRAGGDGQHRHARGVHARVDRRADPAQAPARPQALLPVPFSPVLPILAAVVAVYLMLNLSLETWIRFVIWMVLGFIIYFGYSRQRSRLAVEGRPSDRAGGQATVR